MGTAAIARALGRGALPKLTKLSLKNNNVDDNGLLALTGVAHDSIEWINLANNQIADEGAAAMANALLLCKFEGLRRLSLDHNQLGDGAMDSLASALEKGVELQELYVGFNPASNDAIARVHALTGEEEELKAPRPQSACEKVSLSLHDAISTCVLQ